MKELLEQMLTVEHNVELKEAGWKTAAAAAALAGSLAAFGVGSAAADVPKTPQGVHDVQHQTVGQRNNNPINLKAFDDWRGMTGKDSDGHAIFKDLEHGIRAGYKNLYNHIRDNSDETLRDYMHSYAEANQDKYADFLGDKLGVSPEVKLKDIKSITDLMIAMAKWESKMDLTNQQITDVKSKFGLK